MDSVVVGIFYFGVYFAFIEGYKIAVVNPIRPACRLIYHCDILHLNVFTAGEEYATGRGEAVEITVIFPVFRIWILNNEGFAVAVDSAHTCKRNVFALLGENHTSVSPARKKG